MSESWSFETKQVHAGATSDPTTGARATPIYQTTSYMFRDTQHAAALFGLAELGNIYTRIMNPTQDVLEQRVAALEGGLAALAFASGQAATTLAILNIAEAGDHFVSTASLYGGTYNLFHYTLPKLGIEVSFVEDPDDADEWRAAIRPNTKLLFAETLGNPRGNVLDVAEGRRRRARGGRAADRRQHRADAVPAAADRARRRHRRALGDQVPRRPRHRDRRHHRRLRQRSTGASTPTASRASPPPTRATTASTTGRRSGRWPTSSRPRVQLLRDIGPAISPLNAFLMSRASRRCRCASSGTCRTRRPSPSGWRPATRSRRSTTRACRPARGTRPSRSTRPAAAGAVVAFDLRGGVEAGQAFVDALELHSHLANIGDVRSLVIHPASHHAQPALRRGAAGHRRDPGPGAARRSGWRASRTSWPTSRPGSAPPRRLR